MRWALLLLAGCGRIGFDPLGAAGDDATGDARTRDGSSAGGNMVGPLTVVDGNHSDVSGVATTTSVTVANVQPGDAILVSTGWRDATTSVTSVVDSIGTSYAVTQPVTRTATLSQILYAGFAATAAASVTVTVTFSASAQAPSERVLVYRGVSATSGIQGANGSGNGTSMTMGGFTGGTNWVLVTSNTAKAAVTSVDPIWTTRLTTSTGDVVVDATFATFGIHTGMASLGANVEWITQTFELPPL